MNYFILMLILVLHLKKQLAVLDGELRNHRARPEHIAMHRDAVAEDLGENPSGLQPPVQLLVMCPHPFLHRPNLRRICVVPGALYFVGVAAVALVGLYLLAQLKEVTQNFVKNFNVGILTGRVWTLDPYQVPREDVHTQLVVQGRLPRIFVGREGVPLLHDSLLRDAKVRSIDCHGAVVAHIVGA
jgi:hypothetical protein